MRRISERGQLTQTHDGKEKAVGYHSYTFNKSGRNYSTSEKEMLAVLKAVHYFRTYLDEQKFFLHADHRTLKELLTTKEPQGRTARWIHKLQDFDFKVVHKPGRSISHADCLDCHRRPRASCVSRTHQNRTESSFHLSHGRTYWSCITTVLIRVDTMGFGGHI